MKNEGAFKLPFVPYAAILIKLNVFSMNCMLLKYSTKDGVFMVLPSCHVFHMSTEIKGRHLLLICHILTVRVEKTVHISF